MTEEESEVSEVEAALRNLEGKGDEGRHLEAHQLGSDDVSDDTQKKSRLNEVAKEVLAGDWGVGQESRIKLQEAGFDHVEVQEEMIRVVNQHLET